MPPRNCFQPGSILHHTALSNAFIVRLHRETNALFSSESSGSVSGNCFTDTQRNALYQSSTTDEIDQHRGINLSTRTSLLIGPCLDPSNKLKEALVSIAPVEESVSAFILGVTCRALARE